MKKQPAEDWDQTYSSHDAAKTKPKTHTTTPNNYAHDAPSLPNVYKQLYASKKTPKWADTACTVAKPQTKEQTSPANNAGK